MALELVKSMKVSTAGMRAQGTRLRVIAENLANANSTASVPGGEPYRRKVVMFQDVLDKQLDADIVHVDRITVDRRPFTQEYNPNHPAANSEGYVLKPNVNPLIEMADMREAQRSYEANMNVIERSRDMIIRTIEILR